MSGFLHLFQFDVVVMDMQVRDPSTLFVLYEGRVILFHVVSKILSFLWLRH